MKRTSWKYAAWIVAGLALVVILSAPPMAGEHKRLTIMMEEPYEISGTVYPAGKLSFKELKQYNPTTSFQEVWIDNECIGFVQAKSMPGTEKASSNHFVFKRDALEGRLALVGIAFKGEHARDISQVQTR